MTHFKTLSFCFLLFFLNTFIFAQTHVNVTELANVTMGQNTSDVWGYVDGNGLEYALVGTQNSTRIYSLEDPSSPIARDTIIGVSTTWRDLKSFGDYVYVVTDGSGTGLLIVDMSAAPDTITHSFWSPTLTVGGVTDQLEESHNIYIDEDGYGYLAGHNFSPGGIIILDLFTTPGTPIHVGEADDYYSHDVYVRDSFMYTSEIYQGQFGVYDVTDRTNPVSVASQSTTRAFTHNTWLSDSGDYIFTTDEKSNAYVESYDISDLGNISRLDKFRPLGSEGNNVIPHNVHVLNDFLVVSYYTDGVVIVDAAQPDNLIEVGNYDTWPGSHGGFNGCWGAYPFLPSGTLLASDRQTGLYVLNPTYKRACYLRGSVRDVNTLNTITGVDIEILSADLNYSVTDNFGNYATGILTPGIYDVVFSHASYPSDTFQINLQRSETELLNVFLGTYTGPCLTNYSLTDTLASEPNFASEWIESDGLIVNGGFVEMHATDSVILSPDFEVEVGGQLFVDNDGCN